ncbi:MAG: CbbQ/NirQ/NorQ/GpvN family protein [Spirochaetales bacterium]|nr:CbbQ/NirQ/NorQ/GpvN family protein [Spirochaetales bacterium]
MQKEPRPGRETDYRVRNKPFYLPIGDEVEVFERAWAEQIPLLLKGPTGCGKTRFVEFMAYSLGQKLVRVGKENGAAGGGRGNPPGGVGSLYTVACHEDLTARDLTGRYIMKGGEAVWIDGPAAMAVKQGAILYLDEIVEARKDVTIIIHPLTDHRRTLPLEALGIQLSAPPSFMVVISYNPGYQSIRKNLKQSTKQRFIAIDFSYPPPEKEVVIVRTEGNVPEDIAEKLVLLGNDIRNIATLDLEEGVSTRGLIHAAKLIKRGIAPGRACSLAIAQTITDEKDEIAAIEIIIDKIFR